MADREKRVMNVTIVDAETGETINEFKEITSIAGGFHDRGRDARALVYTGNEGGYGYFVG